MDALSAKAIHQKRLNSYNFLNWLIDIFSLGVPISFYAAIILSNTPWVNSLNLIASTLLLILACVKLVGGYDNKVKTHIKYLAENIMVKEEAQNLVGEANCSDERAQGFLKFAQSVEKPDSEFLSDRTETERIFAYREALKEFDPSNPNPKCPSCGANPWQFAQGSCQMCGNTPIQKVTEKKNE